MEVELTNRGFELIRFDDRNGERCLLQQSSAVLDDPEDALDRPGSSALWLGTGCRMHLDRATVRELVSHMASWLETGSLERKENGR